MATRAEATTHLQHRDEAFVGYEHRGAAVIEDELDLLLTAAPC